MWRIRGNNLASVGYRHGAVLVALSVLLIGCGGGSSANFSGTAPTALDSIQRQIAALACPPGVSGELWNTLRGELSGQLEKRASAEALAAKPPLDDLSVVDDLTASEPVLGSIRLRWSYRNTGDYDQNSETNISDLTPIGRHFNKTPASPDWQQARVADGDLNSEVNISDVTPIGRCFLQSVTEYRVEYNATGGAGSEFSEFGTVPFDSGEDNSNGWLRFDATFPGAESGYYRVVAYYNDQRGIEGNPVYFAANQAPHAVLKADPQAGRTPMTVSFDASESSDPEHTPLTFSWDWEGDGVYDLDTGSVATQEHEYTEEGDYAPRVKVRDAKGAEATAGAEIVSHNWSIYELGQLAGVSSCALIDGKPAFAFLRKDVQIESRPNILCYARSKVPVPKSASDWDLTDVRPAEQFGGGWIPTGQGDPQLFELDGRPAIFHWIGQPLYAFYLALATVPEPGGPEDWDISKVIDSEEGPFGAFDGAFAIDERAYAVYMVSNEPKLQISRSLVLNPQGPEDWVTKDILTWGDQESMPAPIAAGLISGRLSVAFKEQPGNDLSFAFCDSRTPSGPGDWQVTRIDTDGNCGNTLSMTSLDGHPVITSLAVDSQGIRSVRLAKALTQTPLVESDWMLSSPASSDDFSYMPLLLTDAGCMIMTTNKRSNSYRQLLALYLQDSANGAAEESWTMESVNPDVEDDNSVTPEVLFNDGWIICVYVDGAKIPGEVYRLKCAVANLPVRYGE